MEFHSQASGKTAPKEVERAVKTIIHLELSDEQRNKLYQLWNDDASNKMVSRKDVIARIETHIQEELEACINENQGTEAEPTSVSSEVTSEQPKAERDQGIPEFVSSRGDEDYLYRGKDPELTNACRSILDGLEYIDKHTWATLEGNRE